MSSRQRLTWRWRIIAAIVIAVVRVQRWRVDVRGLQHVARRDGAVVVWNHHSYVDFAMVAWAIVRRLGRPVRFLAKREVWQSRWLGWTVRWGQAVPVDRADSGSRHGAFDAAVAALRAGDLVGIAPEQTISRSFELLPFSTGAARMAQRAGVPIVPAVSWGSQRFATKGRGVRAAFGLPVLVRYGEPLHVGSGEDPRAATDRLRSRMATMLDELQRAYPDRPTAGDDWWQPARLGGSAPPHEEVLAEYRQRARRWHEGSESTGPGHPDTSGDSDG